MNQSKREQFYASQEGNQEEIQDQDYLKMMLCLAQMMEEVN